MYLKVIGFAVVLAGFVALVVWGLITSAKSYLHKDEIEELRKDIKELKEKK